MQPTLPWDRINSKGEPEVNTPELIPNTVLDKAVRFIPLMNTIARMFNAELTSSIFLYEPQIGYRSGNKKAVDLFRTNPVILNLNIPERVHLSIA